MDAFLTCFFPAESLNVSDDSLDELSLATTPRVNPVGSMSRGFDPHVESCGCGVSDEVLFWPGWQRCDESFGELLALVALGLYGGHDRVSVR